MKKLIAVVIFGTLIATGAFAELVLGVSAVQYYGEDENGNFPSPADAWNDLQEGETLVYWGGFAEIIGKHLGLGLGFNWNNLVDGTDPITGEYVALYDLVSYDVNIYLTYHFFGADAFIDPFVEAGLGMYAFDYANKDALNDDELIAPYIDDDDPLLASAYTDWGAGLGINLGALGVFVKANLNFLVDNAVEGEYDSDSALGIPGEEYYIMPFEPLPLKWTFGAKLILF